MLNDQSRTSLTRDEIIGTLLGWINGPYIPAFDEDIRLSAEDQEALDSYAYCIFQDRSNREDDALEAYANCLENGGAKNVCRKPVDDFKREDEAFKRFCDEVDDEISKGTLRVDHRSTTSRDTCYTRISVEEWIKNRRVVDSSVGKGLIQASEAKPAKTDSSQGESKRSKSKMVRQQQLILQTLINFGFDPQKLPAPTLDGGARSKVVQRLDKKEPFENLKAFQHAWSALRKSKQIVDE